MKKILLIIFVSLINLTYAQSSYDITEFTNEKAKTRGGSFIGIDDDGYVYTVSYKTTNLFITILTQAYLKVFDAQTGRMHTEVPLERSKALKSIGMEYVTLSFIGEQPTIICKKAKSESPERYYGVHIDRNGSLQGEIFEIGESGECKGFRNRSKSNYSGVYQSRPESENMSFISNISCSGDDFKTYRVLELSDDFNIENTFTFQLDFESVSGLTFVTSGEHLYLRVLTREKKSVDGKIFKKWITKHRLYSVNRTSGAIEEINVQEGFDSILLGDFRIKAVDKGVLISGQIIEQIGFSGIFSALYSDDIGRITDIQTEYFDKDFVTKYWTDKQKKKDDRKRNRRGKNDDDDDDEEGGFSTNFKLIETFETSDEGLISVFQEYRLKIVTTTTRGANGVTSTTTTYYYYYEDVMVVKTGKDGEIEYTKLLPFYQLTINYNPGKGYSALKSDNDIYFLHGTSNEIDEMIDEGKKSNKRSKRRDRKIQFASITHLSNAGDIDTEQILDLKEANISIDPSVVGVDEKNKQFVIVSPVMKLFKLKKTKIVRIAL